MKFIPTADELIVLAAAQRNVLKRLTALSEWSEEDFEEMMLSYNYWDEAKQLWYVPLPKLIELIADSRTPAVNAKSMQSVVDFCKEHQLNAFYPSLFLS